MPTGNLGRGLSSLIPGTESKSNVDVSSNKINEGLLSISVDKIKANPYQPRKIFNQTELKGLSNSIKEHGVLQPLVVTKKGEKYELVAGERRLRAARLADLTKVPVVLKKMNRQKKLELALIENIQRHDLNPIEEAIAYDQLSNEFNLTQVEVAKRLGKTRGTVANTLRLLTLPKEVKDGISEGKISRGHAKVIAGIKGSENQLKMYRKVVLHDLNVRDLEKNVRKIKVRSYDRTVVESEFVESEEYLREALGTKVKIKAKRKGGRVEIEFFSKEELDGIVSKIK